MSANHSLVHLLAEKDESRRSVSLYAKVTNASADAHTNEEGQEQPDYVTLENRSSMVRRWELSNKSLHIPISTRSRRERIKGRMVRAEWRR